jgi:hypothetical protein
VVWDVASMDHEEGEMGGNYVPVVGELVASRTVLVKVQNPCGLKVGRSYVRFGPLLPLAVGVAVEDAVAIQVVKGQPI